jgi:hypothetical protein
MHQFHQSAGALQPDYSSKIPIIMLPQCSTDAQIMQATTRETGPAQPQIIIPKYGHGALPCCFYAFC